MFSETYISILSTVIWECLWPGCHCSTPNKSKANNAQHLMSWCGAVHSGCLRFLTFKQKVEPQHLFSVLTSISKAPISRLFVSFYSIDRQIISKGHLSSVVRNLFNVTYYGETITTCCVLKYLLLLRVKQVNQESLEEMGCPAKKEYLDYLGSRFVFVCVCGGGSKCAPCCFYQVFLCVIMV